MINVEDPYSASYPPHLYAVPKASVEPDPEPEPEPQPEPEPEEPVQARKVGARGSR